MPVNSIPVALDAPALARRHWPTAALFAGGAAILVCRALYVSHYAAAIPFWDQWEAEIELLFKPIAQHRFDWAILIAPHNEHRILFTRLLSLVLWQINGRVFDNRVECYADIALALAIFLVFARLLCSRTGSAAARWIAPGLLALVLCLPIDWENFLVGFQSQFYFAALAALLIFGLLTRDRFTWREWLPACVLAFASLFTMASGLFTAVIACALALWRSRKSSARALPWPALPFVLVVLFGIALQMQGSASPDSHIGWMTRASVLARALGWPAIRPDGPLFLIAWLPLLATLPALRARLRENPGAAFALALAAWSLLAACAIAASRAAVAPAPRYAIALVFGLLANVVFACELLRRPAHWKFALVAVFAVYVATALLTRSGRDAREMRDRFAYSQVQTQRLALFVRTHDSAALRAPQRLQIPYHDPARLAAWLQDPSVLALLPAPLNPRDSAAILSRGAQAIHRVTGDSGQWQPAPLRAISKLPLADRRSSCRIQFIDDRIAHAEAVLTPSEPLILTGVADMGTSGRAQVLLRGAKNYALDAVTGFDEHGFVAIGENAPPGRYAVLFAPAGAPACDTGMSLVVQASSNGS